MSSRWRWSVFCILVCFSCVTSCDDDEESVDAGVDAISDPGDDTTRSGWPDTVTSATPHIESAVLSATHSGLENPNCSACHESVHNGAHFAAPDCASCHGPNGAPTRPDGHSDSTCERCHSSEHAELAFAAPTDCISCHQYGGGDDDCVATIRDYDAVVIGAGGGGLAAAATLALNDMSVVVLEKHFGVGGYMSNFRRGDYRFEVSLHGFSGLDNQDLFRSLDIWDRVEPIRVDPLYAARQEGTDYVVPADLDTYEQRLKEWFPAEADNIDALHQEIENLMTVYEIVTRFIDEGKDISQLDVQLELIEEAGQLGLTTTALLLQRMATGVSLNQFLTEFISDPELITLWTRLAGFLGVEPELASAFYYLIMWDSYHNNGWYYFRGGSQSISDALAEVVEENGGHIRLHSLVTGIDVVDNRATRVRTSDGACFEARYVVSNASAPSTILEMVGEDQLPPLDEASPFDPNRLAAGNDDSYEDSLSALVVHLGVSHDYHAEFGEAHDYLVTETIDQAENFDFMRNHDVEHAEYLVANYTGMDPTMAPEGHTVLGIVTLIDANWENLWHFFDGLTSYNEFRWDAAKVLVERLERDLLPGLTNHIEVMEVVSPMTLRGYTLNRNGALYGWLQNTEQSLLSRLPQQTPIDNLLLAGAWTFPGCGQSAVLQSGQLAGQRILAMEAAED